MQAIRNYKLTGSDWGGVPSDPRPRLDAVDTCMQWPPARISDRHTEYIGCAPEPAAAQGNPAASAPRIIALRGSRAQGGCVSGSGGSLGQADAHPEHQCWQKPTIGLVSLSILGLSACISLPTITPIYGLVPTVPPKSRSSDRLCLGRHAALAHVLRSRLPQASAVSPAPPFTLQQATMLQTGTS